MTALRDWARSRSYVLIERFTEGSAQLAIGEGLKALWALAVADQLDELVIAEVVEAHGDAG